MSRQNFEIVRRGYAMFDAGDLKGIAALFADSAELAGGGCLLRDGLVIRGEVFRTTEEAVAAAGS